MADAPVTAVAPGLVAKGRSTPARRRARIDRRERARQSEAQPATHASVRAAAAVGSADVVMATESLWTVRDVSEFLRIPVSTLHQWRYEGRGPDAYRVGKHVRYDPAAVRLWLDRECRRPHD